MIELRDPDSWLHFARIFDGYSEDLRKGIFLEDHPKVVDAELKTQLVAYLKRGGLVTAIRTRFNDQVDPSRGLRVPTIFVTDGTWVWNTGAAYYLEEHDLLPDTRLLEHIAAQGYIRPDVEPEQLERIQEEFFRVIEVYAVDGMRKV
jgi:hypothetical protein